MIECYTRVLSVKLKSFFTVTLLSFIRHLPDFLRVELQARRQKLSASGLHLLSPPLPPNVHLLMLKYSEITSPCSVCSCCKQSASWSRFLRDYRTKGARVPIPDKAVTRDSLGRFFLISGNPRSGCQWGHSDALVALKTQAHLAQNIASRPEHPWTHLLNVFAISDLQVHEF